jgi:hypothetical protein
MPNSSKRRIWNIFRTTTCVLSNAIGNNGVLTGVVDASDANVGLGGYGFTANPNQYFTPSNITHQLI